MAQTEFRLKISPEEVRDLLAPHLEEYEGISTWLWGENWDKKLWGEVDNHHFKMWRKGFISGRTYSYTPILNGEVQKREYGSIVKIWFDMDKKVACMLKLNEFGLYSFTSIIGALVLYDLVVSVQSFLNGQSGFLQGFDSGIMVGIVVIGFLWWVKYIIKRLGMEYSEEDKKMMTEFLKDLFSEAKINSEKQL